MVRDKRDKRISLFISRWSDKIRDDGGDGDGDGDGDGGETNEGRRRRRRRRRGERRQRRRTTGGGDAGDAATQVGRRRSGTRRSPRARVATAAACARRRAGRDAWRRWLVHRSVAVLPTTSTPYRSVRSATRRTLARATRSRTPLSIFASTCSCAPCHPCVFRRASQGPQGRVVPFGGARQGPDRRSRTAVQQRRPGRAPRFIGAYHHRQYTVRPCRLCLGVRGPGIAELRFA